MRTVRSLVADSASTIDRYGAHPLLLSRAVAHRLRVRSQQRHLREHYAAIVAVPRGRAALSAPAIDLPPAEQLPAALQEPAARVREEAEMALAHVVDLLGSGPVELGPRIDWQRDFKSGYRWSPAFYQDVEITRLYDDSDAKVPWELSRGHQLLTLARAARLYHDERFAAELERQLDSWLQDNPAGVGINWVTPMEAAIRAVNWGWAIGTLEGWRPLDGELRIRVARSLQAHGRHIERNLEGSPLLRGNHYLADVLGLLALARMLPSDPRAGRWRRFARKALEREITTQVGLAPVSRPVAGDVPGRLASGERRRQGAVVAVSRAAHEDARGVALGPPPGWPQPRSRRSGFGTGPAGVVRAAGDARQPARPGRGAARGPATARCRAGRGGGMDAGHRPLAGARAAPGRLASTLNGVS
jgi:hypothetical protein